MICIINFLLLWIPRSSRGMTETFSRPRLTERPSLHDLVKTLSFRSLTKALSSRGLTAGSIKFISTTFILLALTGCANHSYPTKQEYMFDTAPVNATTKNTSSVLVVAPVSIAPSFASKQFTYRTSDQNYISDYYHLFYTSANSQIQQMLINQLNQSSIKSYVTNSDTLLKPNFVLYTYIQTLYADYRQHNQPLANMGIEFKCYQQQHGSMTLVFDQVFEANQPLAQKSSDELVTAWEHDINDIVAQLVITLKQHQA